MLLAYKKTREEKKETTPMNNMLKLVSLLTCLCLLLGSVALADTYTATANGYTVKQCSVCKKETGKTIIYKVASVKLSKTIYTYTGKACDVFISGEESGLLFENPTETALKAEIFDCFGKLLETRTVAANSIVRLPVPRTGRVSAC